MQDNPSPSIKYYELAAKTNFFHPVMRNGWAIKFSVFKNSYILLTIVSTKTGQTIVRYFSSESEACKFISYVVELDPQMEYTP